MSKLDAHSEVLLLRQIRTPVLLQIVYWSWIGRDRWQMGGACLERSGERNFGLLARPRAWAAVRQSCSLMPVLSRVRYREPWRRNRSPSLANHMTPGTKQSLPATAAPRVFRPISWLEAAEVLSSLACPESPRHPVHRRFTVGVHGAEHKSATCRRSSEYICMAALYSQWTVLLEDDGESSPPDLLDMKLHQALCNEFG